MRVFFAIPTHLLRNVGDIGMLQMAVSRVQERWPDAVVTIMAHSEARLQYFCSGTDAIPISGRGLWLQERNIFGGMYRLVPSRFWERLSELEQRIRDTWPALAYLWIRFRLRSRVSDIELLDKFYEGIGRADLVIAQGGGNIADCFERDARRALHTLGLAQALGVPTVMTGQGIGPVRGARLRRVARTVLPAVKFIGLREGRASVPLLSALGVSRARVMVTGDDAIELAYNTRSETLGGGIGVNLRVAGYSGVDRCSARMIGGILRDAARRYDAPLIPLPISQNNGESDADTVRWLLKGHCDRADGGEPLETPSLLCEEMGRCRIVITGAYHGGVFALAQGIPTVALASSRYYVDKFMGLAEQFGVGCDVVVVDGEKLAESLRTAIEKAWNSAEEVRPRLIDAAERQIKLSCAAYDRLYELVASKNLPN